jgi:hypothetical protein
MITLKNFNRLLLLSLSGWFAFKLYMVATSAILMLEGLTK